VFDAGTNSGKTYFILKTLLPWAYEHRKRILILCNREALRSQIERTVALSSASLPSEFTRMISRYQDDPESLYAAGIDYAVQQLRDLIEGGADGVHLYAMNDAKVAAAVYEGIKDLL
jgi:hypothetical protein